MEIESSYSINENMWDDGAEVIQRAASCNDLEKLTLNDILRKDMQQDKQIAAATETDDVDSKEKNNWDPELLEVPFHEFKTLPYEQRRLWLIAHFILKTPENANFFQNCRLFEEMDEDEKRSLRLAYPKVFGHRK
ncbi:uncharacterized protein [Rutidosis leptorrhynchoides]|uniref:uncharacterized protein isoform X2 n=1 Tax=Rutidosis leptorrhynchoides TaxID=125765 RepID=UPI003A9A0681